MAPRKWPLCGSFPAATGSTTFCRCAADKRLTVFDDGTGPALYAGGTFTTAGGVIANNIAKWNPGVPGAWFPLGSGMNADLRALGVFDDGTGPALYAGGYFTTAGGVSANRIAKAA